MTEVIKIGVGGALGRMGRAVTDMALARPGIEIAGRFDRPGVTDEAANLPRLTALDEVLAVSDVVIDFSTGPATAALARAAAALRRPALVVGATGLSEPEAAAVRGAAETAAIVQSGNYSIGVNILAGLVEQAARRLGPQAWDIEVFEAHHRRKVDAPSGTALMLAEAAARGRGETLTAIAIGPRQGIVGLRPEGGIGLTSMRGGGIVGEHYVVFAAEEEIITLSHSARDRALFARGALEAAVWVAGRRPGLYDMIDVLGFRA